MSNMYIQDIRQPYFKCFNYESLYWQRGYVHDLHLYSWLILAVFQLMTTTYCNEKSGILFVFFLKQGSRSGLKLTGSESLIFTNSKPIERRDIHDNTCTEVGYLENFPIPR